MKFPSLTIKDIARSLNLSTSTVSRALRDSHEISEPTKRRVMEYARQVDFKPNRIAQSLKDKRSQSIGVIVCEIANTFFSQVINGIESIAYQHGYNVTIAQSRESAERELLNLRHLTSRAIDGLIISVSTETSNFDYLNQLHEKGLPIVFVDRAIDNIDTHKVILDNYHSAYTATTHLVKKGYRRIALISNNESLSISRERLKGYRDALAEHGLPVNDAFTRYCKHGGMVYEEVETAMKGLLGEQMKPDAVFAGSDKITTGCLHFTRRHRIPVPGQLALIGFSNTDLTELLDPALSVIRQPAFEMGEAAMQLLLSMMQSKRPLSSFETRMLSSELLIRKST